MDAIKQLTQIFQASEQISFDDTTRIILMSDCHRGNTSWGDNFMLNQNIYFAALTYYYNEDYTYIELGDGDELWENKDINDIIQVHKDVFWLLSKFYSKNKLYFIYGNHDIVKKDYNYVKRNLYEFFSERQKKYIPLFENIKIHQGLVLNHVTEEYKILLTHGHQADYFNNKMWRLSRFLVRYLWKPLELFGVKDPTSAAKNYHKKEKIRNKLTEWVLTEKHMLIAGHTHRPVFPEIGETPYFNDGSCVHPRCITGIEITGGKITLVKWSEKTRSDSTVYIAREILAGPRLLKDYTQILEKDIIQ